MAIGDCADIVMGQAPPSEACNLVGLGTPFVKAGEFGDERPVIREWTTQPLRHGRHTDVFVCVVGATCGKVNLGVDCAVGRSVAAIRPTPNRIHQRYLYYFLLTQVSTLRGGSQGAAQTVITREMLSCLTFRCPAREEQERIVSILDQAFESISASQRCIIDELSSADTLFDAALAKQMNSAVLESRLMTLEEVSIDYGRGRSRHRPRNAPHLYGGKYPFVQTGDIRNAPQIIDNHSQSYSEAGLAQSKLWPAGTLCITIAANIAETAILGFDACFPDSVIGVVVDPLKTSVAYLELQLRLAKSQLQELGKGSAQDNINLGTFEKKRFAFPSVKRQNTIVEALSELEGHLAALKANAKQKLNSLSALKQSLLSAAFSGNL